jgi:hypothetical protein
LDARRGIAIKLKRQSPLYELLCIIIAAIIGVILANRYEFFELFSQWSRAHEEWQIDEIFTAFIVLTIGLSIFSFRRWREQVRERAELTRLTAEQEKMIIELQAAAEKIKILRGFLPICSHCKKIRNDEGYWQQLERYISEHSEAQFSHGICPACLKERYSDVLHKEDSLLQ